MLLVGVPAGLRLRFWVEFAFTPVNPSLQREDYFLLSRGQTPGEIIRNLRAQGLLTDTDQAAHHFFLLGRLLRSWQSIKAGEYRLSSTMNPVEVLAVLVSGQSVQRPFTVKEGQNYFEIAADLELQQLGSHDLLVKLCEDPTFVEELLWGMEPLPPTLEGFLYPDTYYFNRTLSTEEMVRHMVKRSQNSWGSAEAAQARNLSMTRLEVITLASIIEKETGTKTERRMVSGVFHHRLKLGMKLQADPTTIYGMWNRYTGKIHREDLLAKNAYNTYTKTGLPVGPIANPGKLATDAALFPMPTDALYFVSRNDGTHIFTRSLEEHQRAVRQFQVDPRAHEGKSWRDLSRDPATR